jgi:hypothetical protein
MIPTTTILQKGKAQYKPFTMGSLLVHLLAIRLTSKLKSATNCPRVPPNSNYIYVHGHLPQSLPVLILVVRGCPIDSLKILMVTHVETSPF